MDRSPPRLSGIPGISSPVADPNHKGIAPAPLLCPSPSPLPHPILPVACAPGSQHCLGLGCTPRCQLGWRCVCLAETLPGLVHPKVQAAAGVREHGRRGQQQGLHAWRDGCCFKCCPGAHKFVETHPIRPYRATSRFSKTGLQVTHLFALKAMTPPSGEVTKTLRQTSA